MPQPTSNASDRIRRVVRRVEADPYLFNGAGPGRTPSRDGFWARVIPDDVALLGPPSTNPPPLTYLPQVVAAYSWETVQADTGGFWATVDPPVSGYQSAFETAGNTEIVPGTIVRLFFTGYGPDGKAVYSFQYEAKGLPQAVRPHDHASNQDGRGGYRLLTVHPATMVAEQHFAL